MFALLTRKISIDIDCSPSCSFHLLSLIGYDLFGLKGVIAFGNSFYEAQVIDAGVLLRKYSS